MRKLAPVAILFGSFLTGCTHLNSNRTPNRPHPSVDPPAAVESNAAMQPASSPRITTTPNDPSETQESMPPVIANESTTTAVAKPIPKGMSVKPMIPKATEDRQPPVVVPGKSSSSSLSATSSPRLTRVATAPKPELDFKSLVQRLKDTSAIGIFTKLSIKNQVDDLLTAFKGYHAGDIPPSLDELHQRYDGLLLKVVTLVQDNDAGLAASISSSRGAIWEKLSDRASFQSI